MLIYDMYTYIYIDRYVYNYIYIVFTLKDTFIANQHWDGISRYLFHCPVFLGYIPTGHEFYSLCGSLIWGTLNAISTPSDSRLLPFSASWSSSAAASSPASQVQVGWKIDVYVCHVIHVLHGMCINVKPPISCTSGHASFSFSKT